MSESVPWGDSEKNLVMNFYQSNEKQNKNCLTMQSKRFLWKKLTLIHQKGTLLKTKNDAFYIEKCWSIALSDLNDYDPKNNKGYRYILVVKDKFSKFGWTVPLNNKSAQTKKKDSFENILSSCRKRTKINWDGWKEKVWKQNFNWVFK